MAQSQKGDPKNDTIIKLLEGQVARLEQQLGEAQEQGAELREQRRCVVLLTAERDGKQAELARAVLAMDVLEGRMRAQEEQLAQQEAMIVGLRGSQEQLLGEAEEGRRKQAKSEGEAKERERELQRWWEVAKREQKSAELITRRIQEMEGEVRGLREAGAAALADKERVV